MLEKIKFAIEKFSALVSSQRTLATVVGAVLIVVLVQNVVVVVTGGEAWEFDEESVSRAVGEAVTLIVPVLAGVTAVLNLIKPLIDSIEKRPPSLIRENYDGRRLG